MDGNCLNINSIYSILCAFFCVCSAPAETGLRAEKRQYPNSATRKAAVGVRVGLQVVPSTGTADVAAGADSASSRNRAWFGAAELQHAPVPERFAGVGLINSIRAAVGANRATNRQ